MYREVNGGGKGGDNKWAVFKYRTRADAMMPNWVTYRIVDVGHHVKNQVRRH
jgi:hypothetical protein